MPGIGQCHLGGAGASLGAPMVFPPQFENTWSDTNSTGYFLFGI